MSDRTATRPSETNEEPQAPISKLHISTEPVTTAAVEAESSRLVVDDVGTATGTTSKTAAGASYAPEHSHTRARSATHSAASADQDGGRTEAGSSPTTCAKVASTSPGSSAARVGSLPAQAVKPEGTLSNVTHSEGDSSAASAGGRVAPVGRKPGLPDASSAVATTRDRLFALFGVAAVSVLVAFDSTIVSTSLPRVAAALDGMSLYAWVASGYLMAMAVTIPIFGRMGDLFGRKILMFWSVLIVACCSVACGLAQSMSQLVIMRSLQGVGGGMMISSAFAAPADIFPEPRERVRWMALLSAVFAVASGIGPVLGGAVTEMLGWRAAFMIVPLVAIPTLWIIRRYFPNMRPAVRASIRQLDWVGGLLLILAVGAPLIALDVGFAGEGHALLGLALLALGFIALMVLIPFEKRVRVPMLPLRVLRTLEARLLNIAALMVGAIMFILIYFGPLLLQDVLGVNPTSAGLLMTPLVMGIPIGSMLNGYLFPRQTQPQRLLVLGSILLGMGCLGATALNEGVNPQWAMLAFALAGMGLGFTLPNLTMFMQIIAERRDVGVASALVQTTRAVGSALGIALVGVFITRTSVLTGIRTGLFFSVACCVVTGLLALRVRMRNAEDDHPGGVTDSESPHSTTSKPGPS